MFERLNEARIREILEYELEARWTPSVKNGKIEKSGKDRWELVHESSEAKLFSNRVLNAKVNLGWKIKDKSHLRWKSVSRRSGIAPVKFCLKASSTCKIEVKKRDQ